MTETFGATPLRAVQLVPPLPAHRQRVGQRLDHAGRRVRAGLPLRSGRRCCPRSCATTCTTGSWEAIDPPAAPDVAFAPEEFGDDWSDAARRATTSTRCARYFTGDRTVGVAISTASSSASAARSTPSSSADATPGVSVTFAVPRASLMRAVEWEIFDDLLIGNFMTRHAARSVAELAALPGLHALGHQVRRQRTGAHRRRAARVLRRVPPPPRRHHLVAQRGRAAGEGLACARGCRPTRRCTGRRTQRLRARQGLRSSRRSATRAEDLGEARRRGRERRQPGPPALRRRAARGSRSSRAAASASASPGATARAVPGVGPGHDLGRPAVVGGDDRACRWPAPRPAPGRTTRARSTAARARRGRPSPRGCRRGPRGACAPGVSATRARRSAA